MPRFAALCLACSVLACAYGPTVGPPPGPVPDRDPTGQPQPAGELAPVVGHGAQRVIAAGIYRGDLTIDGNGNVVQGAGIDHTIVRGNLTIHGDANVVHSLRILGERSIEGQDNDVRGTAFGEPEPPAPPDPAPTTPAPTCGTAGSGDTTLLDLRDGPPRSTPDTVEVVAWFRRRADCGTCPPEALCQPCITMFLFSDAPDAPDADLFWLASLASTGDFREGCSYRLELSLDEGYRDDLRVQDNNPLYFDGPPAVQIVDVE